VHIYSENAKNYTDIALLPATLTIWKYKDIYRLNDQQGGLWSNEVSITVGG